MSALYRHKKRRPDCKMETSTQMISPSLGNPLTSIPFTTLIPPQHASSKHADMDLDPMPLLYKPMKENITQKQLQNSDQQKQEVKIPEEASGWKDPVAPITGQYGVEITEEIPKVKPKNGLYKAMDTHS